MSVSTATSMTSSMEEEERLQDYQVGEKIGHGRFGEVFKITRLSTDELLCWKVVSYRGLKEKEKRQLVAEVNVMRQLRHEHIVTYYDRIIKKADQTLYIVMEYCNAGDLATCISDAKKHYGGCNEEVIRVIAVQLAEALNYCHEGTDIKGSVLHRDLKPQNVFLSVGKDNLLRAKLGDFGLSRHLESGEFAQTCVGTPYYWSPELMKEGVRAYNYKSDMWSFGCILYEMATGSTPFSQAQSLPELKEAIRRGPDFYCRRISNSLADLLRKLLHPEPSQRPSAKDLILEAHENPNSFLGGDPRGYRELCFIEKTDKGLKVCNGLPKPLPDDMLRADTAQPRQPVGVTNNHRLIQHQRNTLKANLPVEDVYVDETTSTRQRRSSGHHRRLYRPEDLWLRCGYAGDDKSIHEYDENDMISNQTYSHTNHYQPHQTQRHSYRTPSTPICMTTCPSEVNHPRHHVCRTPPSHRRSYSPRFHQSDVLHHYQYSTPTVFLPTPPYPPQISSYHPQTPSYHPQTPSYHLQTPAYPPSPSTLPTRQDVSRPVPPQRGGSTLSGIPSETGGSSSVSYHVQCRNSSKPIASSYIGSRRLQQTILLPPKRASAMTNNLYGNRVYESHGKRWTESEVYGWGGGQQ